MVLQNFILTLNCKSFVIINKRFKWTSSNYELFGALFDMNIKECKKYRNENKLPALSAEHLISTATLCESIHIPKQEWLKYPKLLKERADTIHQQYLQLKEGGFANLDAKILAHYRRCINKNVSFLKLYGCIPENVNVAENFISYLNPRPSDLPISDLTDDTVFGTIHHSVLTRYLMWRFETTEDEVIKFYRVYTLSRIKSFDFLSQNFAIAEELGFPPKKLLKYGYLLTVNPKNSKTVLSGEPLIAGMDIRKAMRIFPKLIGISPKQFSETYDYLKKAKISNEAIQMCMNIFTVKTKMVKARLEEIQTVPELKVLIDSPRILKLIVHHNEARSRLSFLKEVKLKCINARILSSDRESFNLYLRGGKDINTVNEVLYLVQNLLKCDSDVFETTLKKHKYYRQTPLIEIEESYKFLRKQRFSNKSITNAAQVLLYPKSKLETALNKMKQYKFSRKITLIEKLNLLLYFIEQEHHFTGNGIWPIEENS